MKFKISTLIICFLAVSLSLIAGVSAHNIVISSADGSILSSSEGLVTYLKNQSGINDYSGQGLIISNFENFPVNIVLKETKDANVLISYWDGSWCFEADINRDGIVNQKDFDIIDYWYPLNLICDESNSYCNGADILRDGTVDGTDYTMIDNAYGENLSCYDINPSLFYTKFTIPANNVLTLYPIFNVLSLGDYIVKINFLEFGTTIITGPQTDVDVDAIASASTSLTVNTTGSTDILITSAIESSSNVGLIGLGKFVEITASDTTAIQFPVTIKVYYTDADLAAKGISESSLSLYSHTTTSGWEILTSTLGNDINGKYVSAQLSHFSIYGVYGSLAAPVAAQTSSGGGGWSCTTTWTCSEWASCANGQQTRTCTYPQNFCTPSGTKPAETQACTTTGTPTETTPTPGTPTETTTSATGGLAGITGAVIGALGTGGTVIVGILIAGLIGTAVTLSVRRFRKK